MCVCIHTYTYIHTYIHSYIHTLHTYIPTYIHTYTCTYTYTYTYTCKICTQHAFFWCVRAHVLAVGSPGVRGLCGSTDLVSQWCARMDFQSLIPKLKNPRPCILAALLRVASLLCSRGLCGCSCCGCWAPLGAQKRSEYLWPEVFE